MRISDCSSDVCSSDLVAVLESIQFRDAGGLIHIPMNLPSRIAVPLQALGQFPHCRLAIAEDDGRIDLFALEQAAKHVPFFRSEERRVGKECVSTCRSRWSQYS